MRHQFFFSSLNVNCAAHLFELLHVKQEGVVKDFFKTIFNILKSIFTRFFLKRNFLKISIVAHPTNFQNTFQTKYFNQINADWNSISITKSIEIDNKIPQRKVIPKIENFN